MKSFISLSIFRAMVGITLLSYPYALQAMPPKTDPAEAEKGAQATPIRVAQQAEFLEVVKKHMPTDVGLVINLDVDKAEFKSYLERGYTINQALFLYEKECLLRLTRSPISSFKQRWEKGQHLFTDFFRRIYNFFGDFQTNIYTPEGGLGFATSAAVRRELYPLHIHPHVLFVQRTIFNPLFKKLADAGIINPTDTYGIIPISNGNFLGFQKDQEGYLPFVGKYDGKYCLKRMHYGLDNIMGNQSGFLVGHNTLVKDKGFYVDRLGNSDDLCVQSYHGADPSMPFKLELRTLRFRDLHQRESRDEQDTDSEPPRARAALQLEKEAWTNGQTESHLSLSLTQSNVLAPLEAVDAQPIYSDSSPDGTQESAIPDGASESTPPVSLVKPDILVKLDSVTTIHTPSDSPADKQTDTPLSTSLEHTNVSVPPKSAIFDSSANEAQASAIMDEQDKRLLPESLEKPSILAKLDPITAMHPPSDSSIDEQKSSGLIEGHEDSPLPASLNQTEIVPTPLRSAAAERVPLPVSESRPSGQKESFRQSTVRGSIVKSIDVVRKLLVEQEQQGEDSLFIPLPTTATDSKYVELLLLYGDSILEETEDETADRPLLFLEQGHIPTAIEESLERKEISPVLSSGAAAAMPQQEDLREMLLQEIMEEQSPRVTPPLEAHAPKVRGKKDKQRHKEKDKPQKKAASVDSDSRDVIAEKVRTLRRHANQILRQRLSETRIKYRGLLEILRSIQKEVDSAAIREGLPPSSSDVNRRGSHMVFGDLGASLVQPHGRDFLFHPRVTNELLERFTRGFVDNIAQTAGSPETQRNLSSTRRDSFTRAPAS